MTEKRSVIAYEHWREAAARFDHLVLGFIAALTAYVGQSFEPKRLALAINSTNVELLSLALFVLAVVSGFKRTEATIMVFSATSASLDANEARAAMMEVIDRGEPRFGAETGKPVSPEQARKRYEQLGSRIEKTDHARAKQNRCAAWHDTARNRLFTAGFLTLVAARILEAYQSG